MYKVNSCNVRELFVVRLLAFLIFSNHRERFSIEIWFCLVFMLFATKTTDFNFLFLFLLIYLFIFCCCERQRKFWRFIFFFFAIFEIKLAGRKRVMSTKRINSKKCSVEIYASFIAWSELMLKNAFLWKK